MKLFELTIEDENVDEVFAISMVSNPAIESFGTYFDKEEVQFREMNEQGLFMAPILIPDKKILRVDGEGKPYEVFFSKGTIKRLSQMYLERKYQDKVTYEHDSKVKNIVLVESWIKEGKLDKSSLYGLNVPTGTWLGTFKIDNDEMKDKFRTGELRAVSIEGLFEHKLVQNSRIDSLLDKDIDTLNEDESEVLLSYIKATIKKDRRFRSKQRVEMESYSDYGSSVKNNAKRGIELNEKNGNKCATQTGKVRAQQLAKGQPISLETIKRMHSYLSRAETYYDNADSTSDCGYISYLLWGGKSALSWSRNKLRELGELEENEQPSISSTYPGESKDDNKISPSTL
jgi:hypothetical protein